MATVQHPPLPSEKQFKQSLKTLKYTQNTLLAKHIITTVETYPELRPSIRECTYSDPSIRGVTLMQLSGNMTSSNKVEGEPVRIPVRLWLTKTYPRHPPVIYINLAPNMEFVEVPYIKREGKIDVGKVMNWKEGKSDLCVLIKKLSIIFNQHCPIRLLNKRSSFSLVRQLKPSHSTLSLRDTGLQPPSISMFKPVINDSKDNEIMQLQAEIDEKDKKIKSLEDALDDTRAKVGYYRNQASEMEAKLKDQKVANRGSFSTGVFDALLKQQDILSESEETEVYKQRMEKMVDELTELREKLGEMKVDKEETDKKMRAMATEYERIKYIHHQLIKERQYLIARQQQLAEQNQSGSDDSDEDDDYVHMAKEMFIRMNETETDDEGTLTDTSDQYDEGNNGGEEDSINTQSTAGVKVTVLEENSLTEKPNEALLTLNADKMNKAMSKSSQDNELQKMRETILSQEAQIETLTKKITDIQEDNEASTQQLKKLLDDAMRKMRRYEVCIDKEEQLEKQKHFLKSQLDRSVADRFEAEKKLRDENWQTRQKLKEVMNRAEWLEHRLSSVTRSSTSNEDDEEGGVSEVVKGGDEMNSVLEHLNVLLPN